MAIHTIKITDKELDKLVREWFTKEEIKLNQKLIGKEINKHTKNMKKFLLDKLSYEICSINIKQIEQES